MNVILVKTDTNCFQDFCIISTSTKNNGNIRLGVSSEYNEPYEGTDFNDSQGIEWKLEPDFKYNLLKVKDYTTEKGKIDVLQSCVFPPANLEAYEIMLNSDIQMQKGVDKMSNFAEVPTVSALVSFPSDKFTEIDEGIMRIYAVGETSLNLVLQAEEIDVGTVLNLLYWIHNKNLKPQQLVRNTYFDKASITG
ncbi:hypothetical protein HDU81_003125 [Chytriomyces hyalinus]|nr:hypothetical protein HDU81_003125 [Chytriomyces hyalinus]